MTQTICPCCKGTVSVKLPLVDLNTNTISFGGTTTRLKPTPTEILHVLVEAYPQMVSYDRIIARVWGQAEGIDVKTNINVQLCYLRRVIRTLPFELITIWGEGIRFDLKKVEIADAA